ncbi:MAG TPA: DUF1707 domain-containing protein [Actinophytocola sp.]|uniref:DUF1707 domain-containing protein n=1 Tax=Actinophytocola sp. TaxID=1872138 RepID=UPI002DDD44AA|nr:DUF1707 domain-containing protein [Actinophytocola sp.]HEV2778662.1 DUF1707 domain-containing protein [Actinophytocola sp.]
MSEVPDRDGLRVGTQEREDAISILGDHFAAGRLPMDEYEARITTALDAKTLGDLRPLFKDLPAPHPASLTRPAPPSAPPAPLPVPLHHDPNSPVVWSDKSKIAAGLLQIMLPFGIGRFYTGHNQTAVLQLVLFPIGVGVIWSIIDGILLLINGGTDPHGRRLRDI